MRHGTTGDDQWRWGLQDWEGRGVTVSVAVLGLKAKILEARTPPPLV